MSVLKMSSATMRLPLQPVCGREWARQVVDTNARHDRNFSTTIAAQHTVHTRINSVCWKGERQVYCQWLLSYDRQSERIYTISEEAVLVRTCMAPSPTAVTALKATAKVQAKPEVQLSRFFSHHHRAPAPDVQTAQRCQRATSVSSEECSWHCFPRLQARAKA